MRYVADTHAFLWYLVDSPKLSKEARAIFERVDQGKAILIVPAIVLLESIDVLDKKKVVFEFESLIAKMGQASNFMLSEINWSVILEVNRLKGYKDLHDRVIVATSQLFDSPLISKDSFITQHYTNVVW